MRRTINLDDMANKTNFFIFKTKFSKLIMLAYLSVYVDQQRWSLASLFMKKSIELYVHVLWRSMRKCVCLSGRSSVMLTLELSSHRTEISCRDSCLLHSLTDWLHGWVCCVMGEGSKWRLHSCVTVCCRGWACSAPNSELPCYVVFVG